MPILSVQIRILLSEYATFEGPYVIMTHARDEGASIL